jgi:glycosyltransferase involved in cell wall biosynthesis
MSNHSRKKVLIIANSRYRGGLSGSDAIYENFITHWDCSVRLWQIKDEFNPFVLCYVYRIIIGCLIALLEPQRYDFIYSASDFLMDSLPAFIMKLKGNKWVAGFFLEAFKENKIHYFTQKIISKIIIKHADMVVVTNPTMYHLFPKKKTTWINGGIDLSLAGLNNEKKEFDAVFCGRFHKSKGIDELIGIWRIVKAFIPEAKLAMIGDGDLGIDYVRRKIGIDNLGITLFGYMGKERFNIYKKSKVVLYPTPFKYDHFSMAPVEAMACGCPMIAYNLPVMEYYENHYNLKGCCLVDDETRKNFANAIIWYIKERWKDKVLEAYDFAKKFDYKEQSVRVFNDIRKELFDEDISYWKKGNGGDPVSQTTKTPFCNCPG